MLVQAFLDAPVFKTRWRWNTTISLAVPRARGGRKVPPQLQRMLADDLMAAVFPDAAACLENIPGDRRDSRSSARGQTVRDCLEEAMDFDGLRAVLARSTPASCGCVARDTPEPSLFAHEILNAQAVRVSRRCAARGAADAGGADAPRERAVAADDLGALDADAIARVREEARPDPRDADELHDALLTAGFLMLASSRSAPELIAELIASRRAGSATFAPSASGSRDCRRCRRSGSRPSGFPSCARSIRTLAVAAAAAAARVPAARCGRGGGDCRDRCAGGSR